MATEIDIAVIVPLSTTANLGEIKTMALGISNAALANNQNDSRISVISFGSLHNQPVTITQPFTQNRNVLQQWLNGLQLNAGNTDGYKAIGNALQEGLHLDWRQNTNDGIFREKVAVLFTDDTPGDLITLPGGVDPWLMSKLFAEQNINLIAINAGRRFVDFDNFYHALSLNTGGAYIQFDSAEDILSYVIEMVLNDGDTFRQALIHVTGHPATEDKVRQMVKKCVTMDDIRYVHKECESLSYLYR